MTHSHRFGTATHQCMDCGQLEKFECLTCDGLRDALQALVTKLNLALPEIENMCTMEHIHGRPYQGPQLGEELKAAEKLLLSMKEPATEKVPCPTCDGLRYSRLVIESRLNQIIQEAQGGLAALPGKETNGNS